MMCRFGDIKEQMYCISIKKKFVAFLRILGTKELAEEEKNGYVVINI
jgi:hypothetical protein